MEDGVRKRYCSYCVPKTPSSLLQKPVNPIRKRSKKKIAEDEIYKEKRRIYLEANPICKIGTFHCTTHATDVHHTEYRIGEHYLDETTWVPSCRICHDWVHNHPTEAHELNFLR